MPHRISKTGSELFIVDNSDEEWKVKRYLHDWCQISKAFDIATGYFEIGSLLALSGEWQKVDKIRILMGDAVTLRTKNVFARMVKKVSGLLDNSIEIEKQKNDFLEGVPAIAAAINSGQIECRVYKNEKFHAKAYITHARMEVVGSSALVGSSNFTFPGLTENIELNVQITGGPVRVLQEWFEEHWNEAEVVSADILNVIDRHIREFTPFEVYAKSLQEFFRGHEMTVGEWEKSKSRMYKVLDEYQKEAYRALMKISSQYGGAFLCDGVGLGKTFVGLMLIERLVVHERKRVMLLVPKSGRKDVWERDIRKYLKHLGGDFSNLVIFNHTDINRTSGDFQYRFERIKEMADVILIDEAHHFRNQGGSRGTEGEAKSRYWKLYDIAEGKTMFFLTATPVNNRLTDLQHIIELFSRTDRHDYFKGAPLGIHSLSGHFRKLEKALDEIIRKEGEGQDSVGFETNQAEAEKVLWNDDLFRSIVVQRSRAYVRKSQLQHGGSEALFPQREDPRVAKYQLRRTYGKLLDMVEKAFEKKNPLFSLAIYYPLAFYTGPDMELQKRAWEENRQKALVGLIRILFLKRFESSAKAFEFSCESLLLKLLAWIKKHSTSAADIKRLNRWMNQNEELLACVHEDQHEHSEEELDEDLIDEELLDAVEQLSPELYKVDEIIDETYLDLDEIVRFLNELKRFKPAHDDKLNALIKLLKSNPELKDKKVLVFTEFMTTARYLYKQIKLAGIANVDEVDSGSNKDRSEIIRRFAPYYNQSSDNHLINDEGKGTRILISTDVLSEGLNLQDATRLINYDIHWNPVRLMQRIGRVDRRLNPEIEARMINEHPELKDERGRVIYWNFLPPDDLDNLLRLYRIVSKKTLRISKVFGIEGRKLLHPEDEYEALKEFNHQYEGTTSAIEEMHLEYERLCAEYPDLEEHLKKLPLKVFTGKENPSPGVKAVFFCYTLPAPTGEAMSIESESQEEIWTEEAGFTKWYLYDLETEAIVDDPSEIVSIIRSDRTTPRYHKMTNETLREIRERMEKHIKNTYLKQVQAPIGVKPVLKAWMELI